MDRPTGERYFTALVMEGYPLVAPSGWFEIVVVRYLGDESFL